MILDATFLEAERRGQAGDLAGDLGLKLEGFWLEAPPEVLRDRLALRTGDASDATPQTLETQLGRAVGAIAWTRLPAHPDPVRVALSHLGLPNGA